jgi:hypothetical protein
MPTPTYARAESERVFRDLNTLRIAAGVGAVQQVATLDTVAQQHAEYLAGLGMDAATSLGDKHTQTVAGATTNPAQRAASAGYGGNVAQVVAIANSASMCVSELQSSIDHTLVLVGGYRQIGVGFARFSPASTAGACVGLLGLDAGQAAQLPARIAVTPSDGSTLRAIASSIERGSLLQQLGSQNPVGFGTPFIASLRTTETPTVSSIRVTAVSLTDALGREVPSHVIVGGATSSSCAPGLPCVVDAGAYGPSVVVLPRASLAYSQRYTVRISVDVNGSARSVESSVSTSL